MNLCSFWCVTEDHLLVVAINIHWMNGNRSIYDKIFLQKIILKKYDIVNFHNLHPNPSCAQGNYLPNFGLPAQTPNYFRNFRISELAEFQNALNRETARHLEVRGQWRTVRLFRTFDIILFALKIKCTRQKILFVFKVKKARHFQTKTYAVSSKAL